MQKITKYWVRFYSPGSFMADTQDGDMSLNPIDPRGVEWPKNAYMFNIYTRTDVHEKKEVYQGKAKQVGFNYYHPDSKVESLGDVYKNPSATKILIDNMRMNNWSHIVWSRWDNWPQPFDHIKDYVLPK